MNTVHEPIRVPEIGRDWINSPGLTMRGLRGRVVLVDFWDYTCVNCIRTLPYLKEWHKRYKDKGLVIIGVHAPEFYFARTTEHVRRAVREFGMEYPVVLDNDFQIWQSFANRYWPAKFLVDKDGYLRFFSFGEGGYQESERRIQQLLKEIDPQVELPPPLEPVRDTDVPGAVCHRATPELYLGHRRGRLGNPGDFQKDRRADYTLPGSIEEEAVYLAGPWSSSAEAAEVAGSGARLCLRYSAAEVNLVMAPPKSGPGRITLRQDEAPLPPGSAGADARYDAGGPACIEVDVPRMYSLVRNKDFGSHLLELASSAEGLRLYAFTFVSCVRE